MTPALVLIARCRAILLEVQTSGDTTAIVSIINKLDTAGNMIIDEMEKRGCQHCPPCGKVLNENIR